MAASPHDEVIVPAITFISTPMAFLSAGFDIRVADVDPDTLMPTVDTLRPLISSHTRAVVVVHLYGQRAEIEDIKEFCDQHGILLVEDCAHRLDLDDFGQTQGDFACYSFNAVKEAPCGEGGLLWARDSRLEAKARSISNVGLQGGTWSRSSSLQHSDYQFTTEIGLKHRLNDIAATMVNLMLDHRYELREKRKKIFRQYDEAFRSCPPLSLFTRSSTDSFLMYVLRIAGANRNLFRREIATAGVATSTHYPSLSRHPSFFRSDTTCPNAENAADQVVSLPCFPDLNQASIKKVIRAVLAASEHLG